MSKNIVKLKIADIIIQMQSKFCHKNLSEKKWNLLLSERFGDFFYNGKRKPHILINVKMVKRLPHIRNAKHLFTTCHFQNKKENWRLLKKSGTYIYKSSLIYKRQFMTVNKSFNRVTAYLLSEKDMGWVWTVSDITYDFLQVLLMSYLAQRNSGIFIHAVGVKDLGGKGMLFAGKSGAGKSTLAKFWYRHSKAMVLNDDRIIVRKNKGTFFIYGSPWRGTFGDYFKTRKERAPLEKSFFIRHIPKNNKVRRISEKEAFNLLYPTLFATFWDKNGLENTASFCQDLIRSVDCYSLGFVKNKNVIKFVREVKCHPPRT